MNKAKYHKVNQNEVEILMNGKSNDSSAREFIDRNERAFDFNSINDYNSIFKYSNSLRRQNQHFFDTETQPLKGIEKFISYGIIGVFYLIFIAFLPFSLLVCLKKIKENERIVNYRLGRIMKPEYKPGYCILFPLVDNYKRFNVVQKEICLPHLQIYNHENAIIDLSTQIRYKIKDVIKLTNTLQDLSTSLKSVARIQLVSLLSKKDVNKIEIEKSYIKDDLILQLNEEINRWGIEVIEVDLIINEITRDESNESGEDPALKSLSLVFKSLFNNSTTVTPPMASGNKPGTSGMSANDVEKNTTDFLALLQGLTPIVVPTDNGQSTGAESAAAGLFNMFGGFTADNANNASTSAAAAAAGKSSTETEYSPIRVLKLLEPLINEKVVKEIDTVYEFHIKTHDQCEIFHLDLKNVPKGLIGRGPSLFSKADCVIKLSAEDLKELLTDNLKPFTAYMSGRIEIDGVLQDVFKLKKLINSVTSVLLSKKP